MTLKRNISFLALALIFIVGGFFALAGQHLSWGPLLLVAGYCVLLPAYLWRSFSMGHASELGGHGGE